MDKNGIILLVCFIIELSIAILTIFFFDVAEEYLLAAIITGISMWVIMIVISITEVVRSERIGMIEKVLWIIGLVSVFNLAGLVYILIRRWRVVSIKR